MSDLEKAIEGFIAMRKSIKKPLTPYAVKLLTDKLDKLSKTDEGKIEILNQSIFNCWQGVFAVKNYDQPEPVNLMDKLKNL